jgi:UDP-N-acetylmuramate dehydrogenase
VEEKLALRKEKQPLGASSAGCLFKNFEFQEESEIEKLKKRAQVPQTFIDAKRIPAGWVVEQLGLRGHRIGDAQISEKHGNFVLNLGAATADHVVQLIALIKTRARNEFAIQLPEEVQYIGF